MKSITKLLLSILIVLCSTGLFAEVHKYYGLRCDRMLHFYSGSSLSVMSNMWAKKYGINEDYGVFSIGIPFVAGYLKECFDYRTFNFRRWNDHGTDRNDAAWDVAAFVIGGVVSKFFVYTF